MSNTSTPVVHNPLAHDNVRATNTTVHDEESNDGAVAAMEKIVKAIVIYYTMGLIIAGCVCNPLSTCVLSRRPFRGTSMSVYLRFLSLMDLGAVLTGLTRFFQISAFQLDVRVETNSCYGHLWFVSTFLYASSWSLVAVTTERVLAIARPYNVQTICSVGRTKITIGCIALSAAALNASVFKLFGDLYVYDPFTNSTMERHCVVIYEREIANVVFWWFDATFFALVPCACLIVFNIIIIRGVTKSRKRVQKITNNGNEHNRAQLAGASAAGSGPPAAKEVSLTLTLFAINTTFVLCNFPICAYGLGPHYQTDEGLGRLGVALEKLFLMLMYTNNSLNFILYCVTGSRFRREVGAFLNDLFHCRLKQLWH